MATEPSGYGSAIFAEIVRVSEGVFVDYGDDTIDLISSRLQQDPELWRVENDSNHFHFDHVFTADLVQSFYLNRSLAEAARNLWSFQLSKIPSHTAQIILVNELTKIEFENGESHFEMFPTLRLWSRTEASLVLDNLYGANREDRAFHIEELKFVPLEVAFEMVKSNTMNNDEAVQSSP